MEEPFVLGFTDELEKIAIKGKPLGPRMKGLLFGKRGLMGFKRGMVAKFLRETRKRSPIRAKKEIISIRSGRPKSVLTGI